MLLVPVVLLSLHACLQCQGTRDGSEQQQQQQDAVLVEGRRGPSDNDYVIPITVKKWMVRKRIGHEDGRKRPYRRNSLPNLSSILPSASSPFSTSQESDAVNGVFAKWNPKINVTWPPPLPFSDASSDMPAYHVAASSYHDDHEHGYPSMKHIQYVPIPYCHHDMHHHEHHKKKEISLIWPLIFLGLLFLPLLLGALLLPLAFLFISNIIQLLNLLQRFQQQPAQPAQGGRRKRRATSPHPLVQKQVDSIADRLHRSLQRFFQFLSDC